MSETMLVKPNGVQVRDPLTKTPLPPEGAEVPKDTYWLRRLQDGDVSDVKPVTAKKGDK